MASNINPNNIDTAYPIAGQDNDSQGFRDNFTNIKTNFQYAEEEIDDLQSKVLLKSALTGTTLDNDMGGALLKNAKLQGTRYTRIAPSATSGSIDIDFSAGSYYKISQLTGNVSLGFTNLPSAGNYAEWTVQLTQPSSPYLVTLPAAVSVGNTTLQGCDANNVVTYNKSGTYNLQFSTSDGGSTIVVEDLSRNTDPIYLPSSEDVANAAAISLGKTAAYFTTAAAEVATLAAGFEGQLKTLMAANVAAGNMVVTVTNPGWSSSATGTITFDTQGDACMLQYINGKWYAVGNNGCNFA
jgi:hypothetical protein